jgi:hypothetical protein
MYFKQNTIKISNNDKLSIESYLNKNILKPNFGGKIISAFEILGTSKENNEIYVWALVTEYYKEDNDLVLGTSSSGPIVLSVKNANNTLIITDFTKPRDGSYYSKDIEKLFPILIQDKIEKYPSNRINKLEVIIDLKKEKLKELMNVS